MKRKNSVKWSVAAIICLLLIHAFLTLSSARLIFIEPDPSLVKLNGEILPTRNHKILEISGYYGSVDVYVEWPNGASRSVRFFPRMDDDDSIGTFLRPDGVEDNGGIRYEELGHR